MMNGPAHPRRRCFQFSLRALFGGVTGVALLAAGSSLIREGKNEESSGRFICVKPVFNMSDKRAVEIAGFHEKLRHDVHALRLRGSALVGGGAVVLVVAAALSFKDRR